MIGFNIFTPLDEELIKIASLLSQGVEIKSAKGVAKNDRQILSFSLENSKIYLSDETIKIDFDFCFKINFYQSKVTDFTSFFSYLESFYLLNSDISLELNLIDDFEILSSSFPKFTLKPIETFCELSKNVNNTLADGSTILSRGASCLRPRHFQRRDRSCFYFFRIEFKDSDYLYHQRLST